MNIILRGVALVVAGAVIQTAIFVVQFAVRGGLGPLIRSGAYGLATIAVWLIVFIAGPVSAIQLWRLRRSGLSVAVTLCGMAVTYYVIGLLFFRHPQAPVTPLVMAIAINGLLLSLLLSPAARRAVS